MLARYGNARVRWSRVDAVSRRKLADVRERVKQLIAIGADRQTVGIPLSQFVAPGRAHDRVPSDYWGCLYPAAVAGKAFGLQLAVVVSANGAELALVMGGERRESRDPKVAAQNRRALDEAQQQLAALSSSAAMDFEASFGKGWRYRKSLRRPSRAADFETFTEWVQYAASPLGAGASISCHLSPAALEKLGPRIVDQFVEMTNLFAPLLQYVYGDDVSASVPGSEGGEGGERLPGLHEIAAGLHEIAAPPPRMVAEEAPTYEPGPAVPASLPNRAAVRAFTLDDALADLFIPREEVEQMLTLLDRRRNLMIEGPPGVGKTFLARRLAYTLMGETDSHRLEVVQFHPSYSYEDFVQGWRPAAGGSFALRNGVFYEFCRAARYDLDRPYVFVIDEINRGNVSAIFGELLMLLERDKRGEHFSVPLTYAVSRSDRFSIPPNVYVIATMNTADRSVAMVDYALRRRFAFTRLRPAFGLPAFTDFLVERGVGKPLARRISTRLLAINGEIVDDRKRLGHGFEIGHSVFVPHERGRYDDAWYRGIIRSEIEPLLREYWFDDPDRVAEAVAQLLA